MNIDWRFVGFVVAGLVAAFLGFILGTWLLGWLFAGILWGYEWIALHVNFFAAFLAVTLTYVALASLIGLAISFIRPARTARSLFSDSNQVRQAVAAERAHRERQERITELLENISDLTAQLAGTPVTPKNQAAIAGLQAQIQRLTAQIQRLQAQPAPNPTAAQLLQQGEATGLAADPIWDWWPRVALNNDWFFFLPLTAFILTGMIAMTRPAGEPLLAKAKHDIQESVVDPATADWDHSPAEKWNYLVYGKYRADPPKHKVPESDRKVWLWWPAWLIYLAFIPFGAVLAFWDEIRSAMQQMSNRRDERRRQMPPQTREHGHWWLILSDFVAAFAAEYVVNRAVRNRII